MQYPIIDSITPAYINNGWTGAGVNIANFVAGYGITSSGEITVDANRSATINPIIIKDGIDYYSYTTAGAFIIAVWNNDTLVRRQAGIGSRTRLNVSNGTHFYLCAYGAVDVHITPEQNCLMITTTPLDNYPASYEPFVGQNFPHILKPLLPHYFPHPVIDALQRAAAGTQTVDDTEVLRHYLTPLGIGGI